MYVSCCRKVWFFQHIISQSPCELPVSCVVVVVVVCGFGIFGFPVGENRGTAYSRFGSAVFVFVFVLFWLEFFSGIGSRFLFDVFIDIKSPCSFASVCGICCVCFEIGFTAPCFCCALFE